MSLTIDINVQRRAPVTLNEDFPLYRKRCINIEQGHYEYLRFDGWHKLTIITDLGTEMKVLHLEDERADFVRDYMTERMARGSAECQIIGAASFERKLAELRGIISRIEGFVPEETGSENSVL